MRIPFKCSLWCFAYLACYVAGYLEQRRYAPIHMSRSVPSLGSYPPGTRELPVKGILFHFYRPAFYFDRHLTGQHYAYGIWQGEVLDK